jgi:hypothetical protein
MFDEVRTDSRPVEAPSTPPPVVGIWGLVALLVILLVVTGGYAWHEHDVAERLATQNSDDLSRLDATRPGCRFDHQAQRSRRAVKRPARSSSGNESPIPFTPDS